MSRLNAPDPAAIPDSVTELLATLPPDPLFKMLSHAPTTIGPLLGFARVLYTSLALPDRLRELAILTLADAIKSPFVWTQHVPISTTEGIDDATRQAIRDHAIDQGNLSDADRVVIRFASEVALGPSVSEETFAALREQLDERAIVELLQVLGYYWMMGRLSTVIGIEPTVSYENYRERFLDG